MRTNRLNTILSIASTCLMVAVAGCGPAATTPPPPPQSQPQSQGVTPPPASTSASVTAPVRPANYERLKGRWLRPDGGYVLEVRSVDANGRVEAAYYNPRPIHVGTAHASHTNQAVQLFVELRDVNYPGSTYTLTYYPLTDRLAGIYFQAAQGQSFDVEFVRQQ